MIELNNIYIRKIEHQDIEELRVIHNDWDVLRNLTDTRLVTPEEQEKWFERMSSSSNSSRLAVIIENAYGVNELIGCIRLDNIDYVNRSILVGGDICKEYRGKGYGKKMFSACLKYVFDIMNMRRAYLSVLETNVVAHNMYKKFGFVEEGRMKGHLFRDGKYFDYINMYLLNDDYRDNIKDKVNA